jgi:purine-binding chemotaxis protein CheW
MADKDDKRAGKYLTFVLSQETYGIEILKVQEIIGVMEITRVPRTPDYMRGVINLRGKVIPVIDLRTKFSLQSVPSTEKTCIIVVQVPRENMAQTTMGILVDEVCEVANIESEQIENTPNFGTTLDTDFILGVGKTGQKVIMLLDVDKVLAQHEAALVADIAAATAH